MKKLFILPALAALIFTNCTDNSSEEASASNNTTAEKTTTETVNATSYSIIPSTIEVKWTAFKLAEKVGVTGAFKSFSVTGNKDNASTIVEMMTGTEITLAVASTKTGDEARDGKIIDSFFGTMTETENITASIKNMTGEFAGTANVEITMNGSALTKTLDWSYDSETKTFLIKGVVNVPDWNAQTSLDELNKVCEEKHKGEGDEAVTWPDVEVVAFVLVEESTES